MEETIANQLIRTQTSFQYEEESLKVSYIIPSSNHLYLPDFHIITESGKQIIIEAKGIWDYDDRYKHYLIRQQHPELDIRFVFQRASNKIRKNSKSSYKDICNGKGRGIFKNVIWKFGDNSKIPEDWLKE